MISDYCVDNAINRKRTLFGLPLTGLDCKDGIKETKDSRAQKIDKMQLEDYIIIEARLSDMKFVAKRS